MKKKNKPNVLNAFKRTKEEITSEYQTLAQQFGNLNFGFKVQEGQMLLKFAALTKELETITPISLVKAEK